MSTTINFLCFQKLKFMEPSRVWYQVTPPDPSNNFRAPSRKSTHALERLRWPVGARLSGDCGLCVAVAQCSSGCGDGVHRRLVHCSAEPRHCHAIARPKSEKPCRDTLPCGGRWFTGPWGQVRPTAIPHDAITSVHIRFYFLVFLVS